MLFPESERLNFKSKSPGGMGEGGGRITANSTHGSVSQSHRSALRTQEDTLTPHRISPFIPQCTLLFPFRVPARRGASTWLPSPSAEGPPCRLRPPLSWLLEAKITANQNRKRNLKDFISFQMTRLQLNDYSRIKIPTSN